MYNAPNQRSKRQMKKFKSVSEIWPPVEEALVGAYSPLQEQNKNKKKHFFFMIRVLNFG